MKKVLCLMLAFSILFVSAFVTNEPVNAATVTTKTRTCYYSCRAHKNCCYVGLTARFHSSKGCTDVYFSKAHTHWPNGIETGSTKKYAGSARGTYTIYSSLITQWVSLAFQSTTDTIYIYK